MTSLRHQKTSLAPHPVAAASSVFAPARRTCIPTRRPGLSSPLGRRMAQRVHHKCNTLHQLCQPGFREKRTPSINDAFPSVTNATVVANRCFDNTTVQLRDPDAAAQGKISNTSHACLLTVRSTIGMATPRAVPLPAHCAVSAGQSADDDWRDHASAVLTGMLPRQGADTWFANENYMIDGCGNTWSQRHAHTNNQRRGASASTAFSTELMQSRPQLQQRKPPLPATAHLATGGCRAEVPSTIARFADVFAPRRCHDYCGEMGS